MRSQWYLLLPDALGAVEVLTPSPSGYECASFDGSDAGESPTALERVAGYLRTKELHRSPGILALPSRWCYATRVDTAGLTRSGRQRQLLFRLEERLPIDAEQLNAGFTPAGSGVFAVAVERARLAPVLAALQAEELEIAAVVPAAIAALQALSESTGGLSTDMIALGSDCFALTAGRPDAWYIIESPADLRRCVVRHAVHAGQPLRIAAHALPDACVAALRACTDAALVSEPGPAQEELLSRFAQRHAAGQGTPWLSLAGGSSGVLAALGRMERPLMRLVVTLLICLVLGALALCWRSWKYRHLAHDQRAIQEAIYHQIAPGQATPTSIRLRLESEHRKLEVNRVALEQAYTGTSPVSLLYECLRRLPTASQFRIVELRLADGQCYLEGEARSHSTVEAIAAALRTGNGFEVEPPRSEQSSNGADVSFSLKGQWPAATVKRGER